MHMFFAIFHWFQEILGINIGIPGHTPRWYNFDSGSLSDLGEVTLIIAVIAWYRTNECHVETCHRLGRYKFQDYKLCHHHSPHIPHKVTHLHVLELYKKQQDDERQANQQ